MTVPMDHLELSRTFTGSVGRLWSAWTTEDGLRAWWWSTWPDTRYFVDGRVGGRYRIEAADHGIAVHGEYLTWDPCARLDFSWIWSDDGHDGPTERVRVTFAPDGDGTRVTVEHTGPWTTPEPAENYRQGWNHVLDALDLIDSPLDTHP
ncbi:SRPBCC family protein [Microbacterium gorillae]|uniref:SRPBCC family protein n=1 Tax=Microbacterium gorillae TaxID=1231063 RepID=UPI0006939B6D|nr:SRPBCC domain-containing protein [Microbacterium gorillae]